eukprot:PITA_07776
MIDPFEKWAIDFIGPINPTSLSKKHILVCTDFVTKWVVDKVVSFPTEKVVIDFLFTEIFTRFGVPREIVSDNGLQFISNLVQGVMEKYKIWHRKSMPYHPQENGQVESINKVIESILTKTINMHRKDWDERLPEALWAYRTTWINSTRHTPYELVYGKQGVEPHPALVREEAPAREEELETEGGAEEKELDEDELEENIGGEEQNKEEPEEEKAEPKKEETELTEEEEPK